jgi:hypothetical protein
LLKQAGPSSIYSKLVHPPYIESWSILHKYLLFSLVLPLELLKQKDTRGLRAPAFGVDLDHHKSIKNLEKSTKKDMRGLRAHTRILRPPPSKKLRSKPPSLKNSFLEEIKMSTSSKKMVSSWRKKMRWLGCIYSLSLTEVGINAPPLTEASPMSVKRLTKVVVLRGPPPLI